MKMKDAFEIIVTWSGKTLAGDAREASGFFERLRGLLGTESLEKGRALIIRPCTGIHTFFMKYPIDALAADSRNRVLAVYHSLKPFRLTGLHHRAVFFAEFPAGTLGAAGVREGDVLEIRAKNP
jgi:uncharacterized membrane protein (UPF0127 family)